MNAEVKSVSWLKNAAAMTTVGLKSPALLNTQTWDKGSAKMYALDL